MCDNCAPDAALSRRFRPADARELEMTAAILGAEGIGRPPPEAFTKRLVPSGNPDRSWFEHLMSSLGRIGLVVSRMTSGKATMAGL